MKDEFDFGFSFTDDLQEVVADQSIKANTAEAKAQRMYDAIVPLLNNLKQNWTALKNASRKSLKEKA